MKADEITVEVKANLEVSKSTAEACLKLVEVYINNNPNICIKVSRERFNIQRFDFIEMEDSECSDA